VRLIEECPFFIPVGNEGRIEFKILEFILGLHVAGILFIEGGRLGHVEVESFIDCPQVIDEFVQLHFHIKVEPKLLLKCEFLGSLQ
jgi:hypothetical protein